jgi:hypothetical protein
MFPMLHFRSPAHGKLAFMLLLILAIAAIAQAKRAARPLVSDGNSYVQSWGQVPLAFEVNRGQTDSTVDYLSRGLGYAAFLNSSGATLSFHKHNAKLANALRMTLLGAGPNIHSSQDQQLRGKVNYFIGNDPAEWEIGIPQYTQVRYSGVYPGVDLVYYGNPGQLEYGFRHPARCRCERHRPPNGRL